MKTIRNIILVIRTIVLYKNTIMDIFKLKVTLLFKYE